MLTSTFYVLLSDIFFPPSHTAMHCNLFSQRNALLLRARLRHSHCMSVQVCLSLPSRGPPAAPFCIDAWRAATVPCTSVSSLSAMVLSCGRVCGFFLVSPLHHSCLCSPQALQPFDLAMTRRELFTSQTLLCGSLHSPFARDSEVPSETNRVTALSPFNSNCKVFKVSYHSVHLSSIQPSFSWHLDILLAIIYATFQRASLASRDAGMQILPPLPLR